MKILIVDSREIVRLGLKKILAEICTWAEVCETANLSSAIEKVVAAKYDFLLIEAEIGGKGELNNLIRLLLQETKVLVFTDKEHSDDETILPLVNAGVEIVISMKDTDLANLKEILRKLF